MRIRTKRRAGLIEERRRRRGGVPRKHGDFLKLDSFECRVL